MSIREDNIQSYFNHLLKAIEEKEGLLRQGQGQDIAPQPDSLKQCHPDELQRIFKEDARQGGALMIHLLQAHTKEMKNIWDAFPASQRTTLLGDYCMLVDSMDAPQLHALMDHDARSGGYLFIALAETHPMSLGQRLKDFDGEELYSLMKAYNKATAVRTPNQGRAVLRMLHAHLPGGIAINRDGHMTAFDYMQISMDFCGQNLQPETLAAMLQEKYELSDLSVGDLASIPSAVILTDLTFQLSEARSEGESPQWYNRWLEKKEELLSGMPSSALLSPEMPEQHNAYAINIAALMETAKNSGDGDLKAATHALDNMLCMGLPVHNLKHEADDKAISVGDGDLYRELDNISLGDIAVLGGKDREASMKLLKDLGWKPLQRSGDETRKALIVREFLGEFFSDYLC
ncbi:hypothetical protein [Sansalvadorimonas verongulae]|uniref:hypothetical protein n=1 Tax=Sansalvadorimonas verongulae TaxID=2172824 RepID=UPI0012BD21B0|nr:hypothetical protein [Sansalvadorimonas verongulae]MTI14938.1 hypothetical protein [Sansalvadorimonas verongulae]